MNSLYTVEGVIGAVGGSGLRPNGKIPASGYGE